MVVGEMSEKRREVRSALRSLVRIEHPEAGMFDVECRDVSNVGAYIACEAKERFEIGYIISMQSLDIEDAPVIQAKVVRFDLRGFGVSYELG